MKRRDIVKSLSLGSVFSLLAARAAPQAAQPAVPAKPPAGVARWRTALCAYSFRQELQKKTMQYEDLVRLAAELGVDGLDLTVYWLPSTSDDYLLPLRRLAYRSGIDIYSIGIRSSLCRSTVELQEAEVTTLRPWLDVAQKLGARHVRVMSGRIPEGASEDQATQWAAETLKRCGELAGQRGIMLGLEDDGALTVKSERLLQIVKQVNSPWVGVNLDLGNFPTDGYRQIELCAPYAVNVHIKSEVRENGKPEPTDWNRVLKILAPVYRGYLSLEYESTEDARTAVPKVMGQLQRALANFAPRV
jgi:sugar phosphate isomerase/epimerase